MAPQNGGGWSDDVLHRERRTTIVCDTRRRDGVSAVSAWGKVVQGAGRTAAMKASAAGTAPGSGVWPGRGLRRAGTRGRRGADPAHDHGDRRIRGSWTDRACRPRSKPRINTPSPAHTTHTVCQVKKGNQNMEGTVGGRSHDHGLEGAEEGVGRDPLPLVGGEHSIQRRVVRRRTTGRRP